MKTLVVAFALVWCLTTISALADDDAKAPELPKDGCLWANRAFSNGATFCWIDGSVQACEMGTWKIKDNSNCKGIAAMKPE